MRYDKDENERRYTSDDEQKLQILLVALVLLAVIAGVIIYKIITEHRETGNTYTMPTVVTPTPTPVPTPAIDRFTGDIGAYRRLGFSQAGATSQLNDPQYGSFPAAYAIDGQRRTSWQEGVGGLGIGETLQLWFDGITAVSVIRIYPGNQMSEYAYYANSRPRQLLIGFSDGTAFTVELEDALGNQDFILSQPIFTTYIALTVLDAYTADWQDTSVSEVEAYG